MITLFYNQYSLMLRNPDFGNRQELDIARINRKTKSGDLIIFRDSIWPTTENLDYKFSYLNQSDLNKLINFIDLTLGQTITLLDYEGRHWQGIIITPSGEVSQPGKQNFTAQFQFQGNLSIPIVNPRIGIPRFRIVGRNIRFLSGRDIF